MGPRQPHRDVLKHAFHADVSLCDDAIPTVSLDTRAPDHSRRVAHSRESTASAEVLWRAAQAVRLSDTRTHAKAGALADSGRTGQCIVRGAVPQPPNSLRHSCGSGLKSSRSAATCRY